MDLFDRVFGRSRRSADKPAVGRGPPLPDEPRENTVDPGAITASDGFNRVLEDDLGGANKDMECHELTVDARESSASLTVVINQGAFTYNVPAKTSDDLVPGVVIQEYTVTPDSDTSDGDVQLTEDLFPLGTLEELKQRGTQRG
jgi:hypothetical protein